MKSISEITGLYYEDEDMVFFRNYIQSAYYIEWGAKLIDLFVDRQHKLVFVFQKTKHEELINRWLEKKKELGMT